MIQSVGHRGAQVVELQQELDTLKLHRQEVIDLNATSCII